ncbi:MAG TPA: hypothetical protein VIN36_07770 [Thiobacillus sp.]
MSYVESFVANFWLALCLYWLPMALCLYGYSVRTFRDYRQDVKRRESLAFYMPDLTVGVVVGRFLMAVFPIANLLAAVFDVAPEVFGDFFRWIGKALDIPLVPKRKPGTESTP